jgi:hypothetical protein
MGWDSTRRLKLFPINGDINSINIEEVLKKIDESSRSLSSQIVCSINHQDCCIDISFNSSKLSGDVDVNTSTTVLWDLLSFEESPTLIGEVSHQKEVDSINYETAVFAFDQIFIKGNQSSLVSFYDKYFPKWKYYASKEKFIQSDEHSILKIKGFYTACNQTDIGDEARRLKLNERINKQTNNHELGYQLYETNRIIEELIPDEHCPFLIQKFINLTRKFQYENKFEGIDSIEFYYKSRKIKVIEWLEWEDKGTGRKGALWNHWSADSWNNCVNPSYLEFKQKRKADNM